MVYRTSAKKEPPPKRHGLTRMSHPLEHCCDTPGWWGCMFRYIKIGDLWTCKCGTVRQFKGWRYDSGATDTAIWKVVD